MYSQNITYNCTSSGGFNRREDNFDLSNYTITCLENNTFTTPEWPKCASVTSCPDPLTLVTSEITTNFQSGDSLEYLSNTR